MRALSVPESLTGAEGGAPAGLDVRARVAVSLLASVATVVISGLGPQLILFGASLAYVLGMRRIRLLLAAYGLVALMFLTAMGCVWLLHYLFPPLPEASVSSLGVPFLRAAVMVNVILPLAFGCRIQALLATLKGMRLPFCVYIPAAVMIRFIPSFLADIKQVLESLRVRGFRFSPMGLLLHPVLTGRLLFSPILFRALRTSEDLGIAAELKGLSGGRRLRPCRRATWKSSDTLLVSASLLAVAVAAVAEAWLGVAPAGGML